MGPCIKLQPCSCCCPGISRYDTIQVAIVLPNIGWSLGPATLTQTVLVASPPESAVGYRCCHCHCQYCLSPTGEYCSGGGDPVGTPDPVDPCEDHPTDGTYARLAAADFTCDPSAPEGGCNPPPAGQGIELPFNGTNSARTLCSFTVLLHFQDIDCIDAYQWPNCGVPYLPDPETGLCPDTGLPPPCGGSPGPGAIGGVLDCSNAICRCPNGLYLKFGSPLYCVNGVTPPFPVIDPDGYIEISAVEPGGDCPDDFPCPEGIYG